MKYLNHEVIDNSIRVGTKFDDPNTPSHEKDSVITDVRGGEVKAKDIKNDDPISTVPRKDFDNYRRDQQESTDIHKNLASKKENRMKKIIVKKAVRVEGYILEAGDILILKETATERVEDDKEKIERTKKDLEIATENDETQKMADLKAELNKLKLQLAKDTVDQDKEKGNEPPKEDLEKKE